MLVIIKAIVGFAKMVAFVKGDLLNLRHWEHPRED